MGDAVSNGLIDSLKVDGNRANQATQVGVGIRGSTNLENIEVRDCWVVDCKLQGIAFFGTSGNTNDGINVSSTLVKSVGSHGIYCGDYYNDVLVEGNHVENWAIEITNRTEERRIGKGCGET